LREPVAIRVWLARRNSRTGPPELRLWKSVNGLPSDSSQAAICGTNTIIYPEVCAWYGSLTFARLSKDKDLTAKLIQRFDRLMTPAESKLIPTERDVDFSVFGAVPLEIFIDTKQRKYLDFGKTFSDQQWLAPDAQGLTGETRFSIDDMFMITIVQVQAYRATGDKKHLDRAALEMSVYLDKLQQPNGLFHHAPDVPFYRAGGTDGWRWGWRSCFDRFRKTTRNAPAFWTAISK
jgi:rhamnogalacturonyl hydrolase YesR